MSDALVLTLTDAGIAAVFNAYNNGFEAKISHIALGDNNNTSSPGDTGYVFSRTQTTLVSERQRAPIGDGERVATNQIHMDMLFGAGPDFPVWEVGAFLEDGTLFGGWSNLTTPLIYKSAGSDLIFGTDIILDGLPPDSVNVAVSGPSVNITLAGPMSQISAEIIRAHRLGIAAEKQRATPLIQNMWS